MHHPQVTVMAELTCLIIMEVYRINLIAQLNLNWYLLLTVTAVQTCLIIMEVMEVYWINLNFLDHLTQAKYHLKMKILEV